MKEIFARIHVANSHGDRAEEGRRSDRKQSANSLWETDESCMLVGANIVSQSRSEGQPKLKVDSNQEK